jgi:hypothetical protein
MTYAAVASSLLVNYRRAIRGPSLSLHVQTLSKIRVCSLVRILISTTHWWFQTGQRQSHAPTLRVTASQPVKFACYILLLFPKNLVFCTLVNVFSPPFPARSVAASHLFSLCKILCGASVSVYLIILNKNINSLYKFT